MQAALGDDFAYHTDRPTYHPAHLEMCETDWWVRPVPWFGSSDLRGLLAADAFVLFPVGDHHHRKGEVFPVLRVDSDSAM